MLHTWGLEFFVGNSVIYIYNVCRLQKLTELLSETTILLIIFNGYLVLLNVHVYYTGLEGHEFNMIVVKLGILQRNDLFNCQFMVTFYALLTQGTSVWGRYFFATWLIPKSRGSFPGPV